MLGITSCSIVNIGFRNRYCNISLAVLPVLGLIFNGMPVIVNAFAQYLKGL